MRNKKKIVKLKNKYSTIINNKNNINYFREKKLEIRYSSQVKVYKSDLVVRIKLQ